MVVGYRPAPFHRSIMKSITGIPENISTLLFGRISQIYRDASGTLFAIASLDSSQDDNIILSDAQGSDEGTRAGKMRVNEIEELDALHKEDVIAISPQGTITVLFSKQSNDNALIVTDRCNCSCIICPQNLPAVTKSLLDDNLRVIDLIPKDAKVIGLTGGEPTVVPEELLQIIGRCRKRLPDTRLEILTNGIALENIELVRNMLTLKNSGISFHIPLYSDDEHIHNQVTGANSFYRTIKGLYNLARYDQQIEIRAVVTKINYRRLPQWATFIARNFPFACHTAIMALEPTGHALTNLSAVWIDPNETLEELSQAIRILNRADMPVSLYNYQLCILPESLRKYARQSISDWKNIYLPICRGCAIKKLCGGFFASQVNCHIAHIHPIESGGAK